MIEQKQQKTDVFRIQEQTVLILGSDFSSELYTLYFFNTRVVSMHLSLEINTLSYPVIGIL